LSRKLADWSSVKVAPVASVPPPSNSNVPDEALEGPLSLIGTLIRLNPAPADLESVPALTNPGVPPVASHWVSAWNVNDAPGSLVKTEAPPWKSRPPPLQVSVPALSSARSCKKRSPLPFRVSAAPASMRVVPVPDIVPCVQSRLPPLVTCNNPLPLSCPPPTSTLPEVSVPPMLSAPLVSCKAAVCEVVAMASVPPAKASVSWLLRLLIELEPLDKVIVPPLGVMQTLSDDPGRAPLLQLAGFCQSPVEGPIHEMVQLPTDPGVLVGVGVDVMVGVGVMVDVLVLVGVGVSVPVDVLVLVAVGVSVLVAASTGVLVGVGVIVGVFALGVGVSVLVGVGVGVGVAGLVLVAVGVSVFVGVGTGVVVGVSVPVAVGVAVLVAAGTGVLVGVGVIVGVLALVAVGVSVFVAVGELLGAVKAANTVKWDVLPVTVPAGWFTLEPPSTSCQVALLGSKK
jgi:hypothetical protein